MRPLNEGMGGEGLCRFFRIFWILTPGSWSGGNMSRFGRMRSGQEAGGADLHGYAVGEVCFLGR